MPKRLNQIVAVEKGVKAAASKVMDTLYKELQKTAMFDGFVKTYTPKDDADESAPPQQSRVQRKVDDVMSELVESMTPFMDTTLAKDAANCEAAADIVVDFHSVAYKVPITFLLFLEKRLIDLHTVVEHIPTLDSAEDWTWDQPRGMFVTPATVTSRTKKVQRALTLTQATDKFPATAERITEDVYVGDWLLIKHSARWPEHKRLRMLARIETLQRAVKEAREEANSLEVKTTSGIAKDIFAWLNDATAGVDADKPY